ncbi:MAG: hydrogenase 4 subunit B [Betaproteobacteria bacterium]|nr:hydrogenase 4 subunit B [Betaproteobacteria bacterium]
MTFPTSTLLSLDWVLLVVASWLSLGVAGLVFLRNFRIVARVLFPLSSLCSVVLTAIGLTAVVQNPQIAVLPIGLPDLPFHLRLDPLAAFFIMLLGAASAGISIFAAGYFRRAEGAPPGLLCLQYHVFLASMVLVLMADDAYVFMVMWETMALSSFFLVTTNHRIPEIRRAGFLYILVAHIGAIAILLCFGVLQANTGDYTFANMRAQSLSPFWASAAFLLCLFGFGAKAGILPLHIWLPEAHPAAPSPISALMSGVMLKTAIYGLLRVSLDLIATPLWWWGVVALSLGLLTAMFGAVFAAVQTDMKRLLAYSSIENIGLLIIALGLTLIFTAYKMPALAALALIALLYHALNHAVFKSLLFLGTGSVLHSTGERSLGKLGGLMRFMPWVGWIMLIGIIASAGLPPLNGFVSEWLLLQSLLTTTAIPNAYLSMLVPIFSAGVVLVAALAGYVMVKFFGIIFLGQPREEKLTNAHDAGKLERLGLLWLATGCVLLGVFPVAVIEVIDPVAVQLLGQGLAQSGRIGNWLLLAPVSPERASYSPLIFLLVTATVVLLTIALVHRLYHSRIRRANAWDCGYPLQTARMQDSAEGFGQPIRQIFEPFFRLTRQLPTALDRNPLYKVTVEDPLWQWVYQRIAKITEEISRLIGKLQQGRISIYLLYSFITLIALLFFTQL